jgi:hypothetical protein
MKKIVLTLIIGFIAAAAFASGKKEIALGTNSINYTGYQTTFPIQHQKTKNNVDQAPMYSTSETESYNLIFWLDKNWQPLGRINKKVLENHYYSVSISIQRTVTTTTYDEDWLATLPEAVQAVYNGTIPEEWLAAYPPEVAAAVLNIRKPVIFDIFTVMLLNEESENLAFIDPTQNLNGHFTLDEIITLVQNKITNLNPKQ